MLVFADESGLEAMQIPNCINCYWCEGVFSFVCHSFAEPLKACLLASLLGTFAALLQAFMIVVLLLADRWRHAPENIEWISK